MFGWLFGNKKENLEEETRKSFSAVKDDIKTVGKWIKHLDEKDKQLFNVIFEIKSEIATIREELVGLKETVEITSENIPHKQVFKKLPVLGKQTDVLSVENTDQTPVQTANIYETLKGLSSNERVIIFTLMNSEMKLSYEDLAMMLGKERSTIRGQINAIKQESEGLIEEMSEKNGKKRVYIPYEIKEKLAKYAKVRVGNKKK